MRILLISLFIINQQVVFGQFEGNIWCFGDSILMKFDSVNNVSFNSCITSCYEPAASISDHNGNLLLYLSLDFFQAHNNGRLLNGSHQLVSGADSLMIDQTNSCGAILLPRPGSDSLYYFFHTTYYFPNYYRQLFFSEIDIEGNGGTVTKNQLLSLPIDTLTECIAAVRHGNGRDYWLLAHGSIDNKFYFYLVDSNGVTYSHQQAIGTSLLNTTPGLSSTIRFNSQGNSVCIVNSGGIIDVFDFDRCLGVLNNHVCIDSVANNLSEYYVSCSYSFDGNKLYISSETSIWQVDLNSAVPQLNLVYNIPSGYYIGHMQIGPDKKIYIPFGAHFSLGINYTDSINTRLSVINYPDSSGLLCDFVANAPDLYVGRNKRTRSSIPNLPNYQLGVLSGSICDPSLSIVDLNSSEQVSAIPNPAKDLIRFNFGDCTNGTITVCSIEGKVRWHGIYNGCLNVSDYIDGMYFVKYSCKTNKLYSRFVKE